MPIEAASERLQCVQVGNVTIIRLFDRVLIGHIFVHHIGEELERILEEQTTPNFIVNLSCVEMLSSTMMGKLIRFHSQIGKRGGRLVLTNVHTEVQGVFAITRLDHMFTVRADETDALAMF